MTAIGGIIGWRDYVPSRTAVTRMTAVLTKFGHDQQHIAGDGRAVMLRTLLRSTPEDLFDRQPLSDARTRTLLTFDGRIDNRDDLSRALDLAGPRTARMADADLVLAAVLRWGEGALQYLEGDFALAVWNGVERILWLARDPIGARPLYWHEGADFVAFATQPSALFAIDGIRKELDMATLTDTLALLPSRGEGSYFKGIQRVVPGHVVKLSADGRPISRQYFDFTPRERIRLRRDEDYIEALQVQLDRAVSVRLRSRGGIASHLSSGLDSSSVTVTAARLLGEQGRPLHAVTAAPREGFDGPVPAGRHADESRLARLVADRYRNIKHSIYRDTRASHLEGLDEIVDVLDRPPLNLCNLGWSDGVSRFVAEAGDTVVLNGTCGNMTLAYPGFQRIPTLLRTGQWGTLAREWRAILRRNPAWSGRMWYAATMLTPFIPIAAFPWWSKYVASQDWSDITPWSALNPTLVQPAVRQQRFVRREPWNSVAWRVRALQWMDPGDYSLLDDYRRIQSRDPLADTQLIRFLLAIPDDQYFRNAQPRYLFYRTMERWLPPQYLTTRTRGYQSADYFERIEQSRDALRSEIDSLASLPEVANLLDLDTLRRDVDATDVDWGNPEVEQRYRLRLLRGLSVGHFAYRHIAGNDRE